MKYNLQFETNLGEKLDFDIVSNRMDKGALVRVLLKSDNVANSSIVVNEIISSKV